MISAREETIEYLKELGFTEYESKIYLSLLGQHPASAYTISQNSNVPHSRVYDVARRMAKRGVVVSNGKNPETFSPLSPEELIGKLRRDNERFTSELKQKLESVNFQSDFDPVWNLHSQEEAFEMARSLIKNAEKSIYAGFWAEDYHVLEKVLRKASQKGVKVFMLIYGSVSVDFGKVYYHETEYLTEEQSTYGRTLDCAMDSSACITGSLGGTKPSQIVWTRNQGLVNSIQSYIIHDFYLAEMRKHYGEGVEEAFGPNLIRLRQKFSS